MRRALSLNKAMLRQILILRLVSQKPRLKWCLRGNCVIPRNALYVIARSNATWQSPGMVTLLIIWCFLSNCQKDTLAIIYNRCVLININTSVYDMEIKSGRLWYIEKNWLKFTNELYWYFNWFSFNSLFWANKMVQWQGTLYGMDNKTT